METRRMFPAVTGAAAAALLLAALVSPRASPTALLASKMSKQATLYSMGY